MIGETSPARISSVEWNATGDLADVQASLTSAANSDAAFAAVKRMRGELAPAAFDGAGAKVYVSGATAFNGDFHDVVDTWTPRIFVLGFSFLLLLLAFRSIVVPLKAVLMNLISVGAALIMVAVFAGMASGELVTFQQVGFGLAVAIILDATIIRMVLVPASMELLGRWNWHFPAWLEWLPKISIEGQATQSVAPTVAVGGDD